MGGQRKPSTLEMTVLLNQMEEMNRRIEHLTEQQKRPATITGSFINSVLSASSSVNGTVTGGDAVVSFLMFSASAGAGLIATPTLYALGMPWDDAANFGRIGVIGGVGLCWIKTAIDALDLYSLLGDLLDRILTPGEQEPPPTNTVVDRPLPIYDKDHEPPIEVRLCGLPNDRTIAWDDLTDYLEIAQANFARWGTKAWSREAWVGKPYPGYPQLGSMPFRTWQGVRQLCNEWVEQFPAFTDKAGRSKAWQTGDPVIIRDFVDLLDAEL